MQRLLLSSVTVRLVPIFTISQKNSKVSYGLIFIFFERGRRR